MSIAQKAPIELSARIGVSILYRVRHGVAVKRMPPPYRSEEDLPYLVRRELPDHAQEIWMETANSAWEQYKDPGERRDPNESREEVTYKVAWAAVKQEYKKDASSGEWRRKGD